MNRYWHPWQPAVDYAARQAHGTVVEIGPGFHPFAPATIAVGRGTEHDVDLCRDPLPFDDQSVDYLYCRHTLEDLDEPVHLLREIRRVAKAGWIETPSPLAELTRGVDMLLGNGEPSPWRGYIHHRWMFWNDSGTLKFCAKYGSYLEHFKDAEFKRELSHPVYWNTYFNFTHGWDFQFLQHEVDYNATTQYADVLQSAVDTSRRSCASFNATLITQGSHG